MNESIIVLGVFAVIIIVLLVKTAVIVPQRSEFVVERLPAAASGKGQHFEHG